MQDIWEDKFIDLEQLLDKKEDPTAPLVLKPVQSDSLVRSVSVKNLDFGDQPDKSAIFSPEVHNEV